MYRYDKYYFNDISIMWTICKSWDIYEYYLEIYNCINLSCFVRICDIYFMSKQMNSDNEYAG